MILKEKTEETWAHREAVVNKVRLHYIEVGEGPLVVLLHGFPEFWYSWRYQIPALAAAGFHVIAPDLRGYNQSEKPKGVHNYRIEALVDDLASLIRYIGARQATIVGHDWGGVLAWTLPMRYPEIVEKLIILNAPHPGDFIRKLWTPAQLLRSWYMFFFQIPWLPEAILRMADYALIERALQREPVRKGSFTDKEIRRYQEALAQPGALTAGINYYRALFRRNPLGMIRSFKQIAVPTLLIWGEQDRYLGIHLTEGLDRWASNIHVERLPQGSHWVQMDAPDRVNELLIDFLGKGRTKGGLA